MTDMTPGYILSALEVHNPSGLVIRHKINELGIVRKQLAADCGLPNVNYLSMITSETGRGPSFATETGPRLVAAILDAERAAPGYLRPAERKNFARRRALMQDAMTLLSIYTQAPRQAGDAQALFARFAAMVPQTTYRAALGLVGQAILGPLAPMRGEVTVPAAGQEWMGSRFAQRLTSRRLEAETLFDIDRSSRREEIFQVRGKAYMAAGMRRKAMQKMIEGYEGLVEAQEGAT